MYLAGYDIGGTKLGISLGTEDGTILGMERIPNRNTRPEEILPQIVAATKKLAADSGIRVQDIRAFGISSPGPADYQNGIMTSPTNNPLWRNVPIRQYLSDELGMEGFFENDANCGALAEGFFGAGKGCKHFIYLTMSTGIGAGIVAEGKLIRGVNGAAGEFGHAPMTLDGRRCNCGLRGCYEAYCGGLAIENRIREELKDQPDHPLMKLAEGKPENINLITLEKGVRAGDAYSMKLWDEMCLRNAQAYGILMMIFNPEKIILGTIAWASGDLFMDPVKKYVKQFAWKENLASCQIVPSMLKREISSYAGLACCVYYLREKKVL